MNNFFDELEKNSIDKGANIKKSNSKNIIGSIIKALCWLVIIIGFVLGIVGYTINEDTLEMITTWLIYGGCSLGGFALAEIIQILHDIRDYLCFKKNR